MKLKSDVSNQRWPPLRLAFVALVLAFGSSFSFGFQLLITNPAQVAFINFLNQSKNADNSFTSNSQLENEWSFVVALLFLGSVSGSFLIRTIAEKMGRKNGVLFSVFSQAVASLLSILSYWILSSTLFAFARFLMGMSITISMGVSAMFVTESSPANCRGVASLINGILLQFSVCVGAVMAMPKLLGNETGWWYLYLIQLSINCAVLCILPFAHESPGFLASHNKYSEVKESIKYYHMVSDDEAEQIAERLIDTHHDPLAQSSFFSIWRVPFTRRGTLLGMLVTFSMAMSGITVINAFGFQILKSAGLQQDTAALANVIVCLFSLAGITVSTKIIDDFGRRPLLIFTFSLLAVVNTIIASLMYIDSHYEVPIFTHLLIAVICIFNFLFAMGPGPVSMFLTGELVPQRSRSASSVWANSVMAVMRFLTLTFYTPFKNYTSDAIAYASFFIVPMIAAIFVLLVALPETKGRNAEDLQNEYEAKELVLQDQM